MSEFAREAIEASRATDRVFGDVFSLQPMKAAAEATASPVVDGSRSVVADVRATLIEHQANERDPNAYDVRQYRRPGVEAGKPVIEISAQEVERQSIAANAPFWCGPLDKLTRQFDGAVFAASARFVTPNGTVRLTVNRSA